jgi:hydrogenase expression/formation protein HypE
MTAMNLPCPQTPKPRGTVELSHGSGGRAMHELIQWFFAQHLDNPILRQNDDGARLPAQSGEWVMTTDAHVVSPLFFPGGDIGCLAIHGTVNDLAMMGAQPRYIAAAFILEEGFPLADLERIVISMSRAANESGVCVVTGDTKVVDRGKGDGVFITTTGLGILPTGRCVSGSRACVGDAVLLSGSIADHGMAVLAQRESLHFDPPLISDTAPLNGLVEALFDTAADIHVLRDPTRGGLAATLHEIALQSQVNITIDESAIVLTPAVSAACELLGIDPLHVANEGKLLAICAQTDAALLLSAMQRHPAGLQAAIIGTVTDEPMHGVQMITRLGGRRMVEWLSGAPLPRIC